MLNFDLHISDICKKAARQINVLCRLSRYLSTETKQLIYKSFVDLTLVIVQQSGTFAPNQVLTKWKNFSIEP